MINELFNWTNFGISTGLILSVSLFSYLKSWIGNLHSKLISCIFATKSLETAHRVLENSHYKLKEEVQILKYSFQKLMKKNEGNQQSKKKYNNETNKVNIQRPK